MGNTSDHVSIDLGIEGNLDATASEDAAGTTATIGRKNPLSSSFSNIRISTHRVTISFQDLHLSVDSKISKDKSPCAKGTVTKRTILSGVSGVMVPGTLYTIMGKL